MSVAELPEEDVRRPLRSAPSSHHMSCRDEAVGWVYFQTPALSPDLANMIQK